MICLCLVLNIYACYNQSHDETINITGNMRHSANVGLMLSHCLRCRASIKPALAKCLVCSGMVAKQIVFLFVRRSHKQIAEVPYHVEAKTKR